MLAFTLGCDTKPVPATKPAAASATTNPSVAAASTPVSQPVAAPALADGWSEWSKEAAIEKLSDENADAVVRRSAAVRLVRLSNEQPLCVPDPLPDRIAEKLSVRLLARGRWVLGLAGGPRGLDSPVILKISGEVLRPVSESEEEAATLYVSDDAEIFPHVIITPVRVLLVRDELKPAMIAKAAAGMRFAYERKDDKWPFVAVKFRDGREVTRYRWDPSEDAFVGPAAEKLTDSGERFELDLSECKALVPEGGDIPDAPPPVERDGQPPRDPRREPPPE